MTPAPSALLSRLYETTIKSRGARRHALQLLRSIVLKVADPPVRVCVRGKTLTMPLSHAYPLYAYADPNYDTAIVRLVESVTAFRGHCAAIDIGANVGYTARAILDVPETRVLCIEGSEVFGRYISTNLSGFPGRYTWLRAYAGNPNRSVRARSVMGGGTARLVEGESAPELSFVSLSQAIEQTGFDTPDFIKIDTDGYDTKILAGELSFLAKCRPVLFFEFDPNLFQPNDPDGSHIVEHLASCGYRHGLAYSNHGHLLGAFRADRPVEFQRYVSQIEKDGTDYLDVGLFPTDAEFELAHNRELAHFAGNLAKRA